MKTKKEILKKINNILIKKKDALKFDNTETLVSHLTSELRALRWVLGYKLVPRYWCYSCQIAHLHLECPQCGNDIERIIINTNEENQQ